MKSALKEASSAVHWLYGALGMNDLNDRLQERRSTLRLSTDFWAMITTGPCPAWVRGVNIDRRGAGVIANEPIGVGAQVFIRLPELERVGFAEVRHCLMPNPGNYRVGLRFSKGLQRNAVGLSCFEWTPRRPADAWDGPAD